MNSDAQKHEPHMKSEGPVWSDRQLEILNGTGNMLVSASAGSGKTTVMIERIRRLLAGGARLRRMVVCTFTNAAAADMKYKLAKALTESGLKSELEYLPQADISTIHGVCARLVRSYFYHTDVDPAFELLSEGEAAAIRTDCLTAVLERATGERFALLYDALLSNRTDRPLRKLIGRIYDFARTQPSADWLNDCLSLYDDPAREAALLNELCSVRRRALAAETDTLAFDSAQAGFARNATACGTLYDYLHRQGEPMRAATKVPDGLSDYNERYKRLKKRVKTFLEEEDELLAAPAAAEARGEAETLVALVRDFAAEYAAAKARRGKLDFSDLEHYALEILSGPAADEIAGGLDYVFVDEYQDVNPLQEAIINKLAARAQLFEVGDLKQSIYAFRLCDPRIFAEKYRRYRTEGGGKAIDLNVNYRSADGVIAGVNEVFSAAMTASFGGMDYTTAPLVSGLHRPGEAVRLKVIPPSEGETFPAVYSVRADTGRPRSGVAAQAAADVEELLSGLTDGRPVRPSDIAVIARSRTEQMDELYDALKERGIPVAYAVKSRAADSPAVRPLINMLRLIDNRTDDVMLAAVLKSRFGGFSDDELADIRRAGGDGTFAEAFAAYRGPLRARMDEFVARLDRYETVAAFEPADYTAGLIVSEAEYFEYLYSLDNGEALAAALSGFLKTAGACAYTLPELLDYVDGEPEEQTATPVGDCVRLMTVHASKGLEFKYVLLLGAERKFRLDDATGPALVDRAYGLVVKRFDYQARRTDKTKAYYLTAAACRQRMREEELRILYVAMTRAQDKLYIYSSRRPEEETDCFLEWLGVLPAEVTVPEERLDRPVRRIMTARPDAALTETVRAKLAFRYPHRHDVQKTAVTALAEAADEEAGHTYTHAHTDAERAAETGTAYHLMMEHIDFTADFTAEWARLSATFPSQAALCDAERIRRAAETMRTLTAGKRVYREQPFIMDKDGTLVQGVIDVLLLDGDGATVVDYKTTRSTDLRTPAYLYQTAVYARATERILGVKVRAVYLYSFFTDSLVPMPAHADI